MSDEDKSVAEEDEKEGKLVCITGLVGSGKRFVADFLASEVDESLSTGKYAARRRYFVRVMQKL